MAALLACALLLAPPGAAATSIMQAVETALRTHPQIASVSAAARAAREDVSAARAGYLPTLDAEVRAGRERSNIKQLRLGGADDRYLNSREFSLTLRQMIYDGEATSSETSRREALLEAAGSRVEGTREAIAFSTVQVFLDVLKNRELVMLARDNVAAHEELQTKVRRRVERGLSGKADLQQAVSRLALAQSTLVAREGSLREAVTAYARVVGEAPGMLTAPAQPDREYVVDGAVDHERLARAIEEGTSTALADHPALQVARSEVEAASVAARATRSAFLPRLDLEASVRRDANLSGVDGVRNVDFIGLVGRWNLFRGGGDTAREKAAVERHFAVRDEAADTRRVIEQNVALAIQAKATGEARLVHLAMYAESSRQTLASYRAQLELGRRTLLDTLNAESELFNAQSSLTSGRYDDMLNYYFVEASKGLLSASLGLAANP